MSKYPNLPTLILIALVCVCATVLAALGMLPSEAVTAILGGAVAQAVAMTRKPEPAPPTPQPTDEEPAKPAKSSTAAMGAAPVGMLIGSMLPALLHLAG